MTEDPLERIEREEREKKNKGLKSAMYVLAAVAALLAAALGYLLYQKSGLVHELEDEKADLTEQLVTLKSDFATLNSDYEFINSQLDTSRQQVDLLIEKLQKTEATNRAKIRQYEKELGTLRSIMKSYIYQIDSLNTRNKQLTADVAAARKEAAESQRANEALTQKVDKLSTQVAAGSAIKARGLVLEAYNASDKVTDRSSRVTYMIATLALVENDIAEPGPVRVYVQVKDPDGNLLTNSSSGQFSCAGQTLTATASREVDYQRKEITVSIYIKDVGAFQKGIYTVDAYTTKGLVGHYETMLR